MKEKELTQIVKWLSLVMGLLLTLQTHAFTNFVTRDEDQLKDGKKIFRFISVNTPNITGHYDGYKNTNPESGFIYDPIELTYEKIICFFFYSDNCFCMYTAKT